MSDETTAVYDVPPLGISRAEAEARGVDAPFGRDDQGEPLAPFGHRQDGGIRLKPGRKDGQPIKRRTTRAPAPSRRPGDGSSSPSRGSGRRGASTRSRTPDYRPGIRYVTQTAVQILTAAGLARDEIFIADAVAVQTAAPDIADGLNRLAPDFPWLARGLEVINRSAPYVGLSAALSGLSAQLVANHVPAARPALCGALGLAVDPDAIIAEFRAENPTSAPTSAPTEPPQASPGAPWPPRADYSQPSYAAAP